jgi:hypothetical protein
MGLKHLPLISIVLLLLSILVGITLGGQSLSEAEVPWLLVEGQRKMLADFTVLIGVASALETWQKRQIPDVPLSHNNHKRDPQKECCTH